MIVDDRSQVEGNVILGHADLTRHLDDLDLDINSCQVLAERVDLYEAGINCTLKTTKLGHQSDLTLVNGRKRIRAADTAGYGSQGTNDLSQPMNYMES